MSSGATLVHPWNHDPALRVLISKLLLVVLLLLLCPDSHLKRSHRPEEGRRRVEREHRVDEPAERLKEVVRAGDGVEGEPCRDGASLGVVRRAQRAEDQMANQVGHLGELRGRMRS